jgi:hypothetical protein
MVGGTYPDFYDTSQDFVVWTNTVQVKYYSKSEEKPPSLGQTINNVLWNQIRKDKLAPDSPLMEYDRTFRFAKAMLQGIIPKQNDIITDDEGLRWKVELVEVLSFGNEYRVHTTKGLKQGQPVG